MSSPEDAAVVEAAAAALTASAPPAAAAPGAAGARCDNCGASVPGRYCGNCGQRLEPPVHSLWHFLTVAFEDVTHADSRLWRTLWALLFKPGFLTREFLCGRRARYLPPVRLYLVLSVVFFLWAAGAHSRPGVVAISADAGVPKATRVVPLTAATAIPGSAARPGESVEQRNARECGEDLRYNGPWATQLRPALQRACLRIRADNARSLMEGLWHNMPRAMFLFLPLIAAIMRLLYWRPPHYYVEHLLLLVHNHAFVFLVLPLGWVVKLPLPFAAGVIDLALFVYVVWYVYRSMRAVYRQGHALTLAKFAVLAFFYFVFGMALFVISFVYSAVSLA